MTLKPLQILLAAGLLAVAWMLWPAAETPNVGVQSKRNTTTRAAREAPDEAEIAQRRKARLLRMAQGKVIETRLVTVRALKCGLMPAPHALISVDMGQGVVEAGEADGLGKLVVRIPKLSTPTFIASFEDHDGAEGPTGEETVSVNACPGATVEGLVLSPTGEPVPNAEVVLGEEQDLAVTDEEGRFVVTDLFLTAPSITAKADGLSAEATFDPWLKPRETRQMTLRLERGRRLVGVVLDRDGTPVPKASVTAMAGADTVASTRTDRRGRFWLKGVPFLPVALRALSDRGASKAVAVGEAETRSDLVLTIEPGAQLVVSGGDGNGVYEITDRRRPGQAPLYSLSGLVAVATVDAPGQYEVVYRLPSGVVSTCGQVGVVPGDRIEINCGAQGNATVSGRAVGSDGQGLAGVSIYTSGGGGSRQAPLAVTGTDGSFSFSLEQRGQITVSGVLGQSEGWGHKRGVPVSPGVVSDIGDLSIVTRDERRALHQQRQFGGVGAVLARSDNGPMFQRLVPGGPLDKAGVQANDVILSVDGDAVYNESVLSMVQRLRGEPGSSVSLRLWRGGQEIDVNLVRGDIDADKAFRR